MNGSLDKLQNAVFQRLISLSDINFAEIFKEQSFLKNLESKASGLTILIELPLPLSSSKFSAGPTFADVQLKIIVTKDSSINVSSPSILFICECISKALHNWQIPVLTGFSKISLSQNNPWQKLKSEGFIQQIAISFVAQSAIS